MPAISDSNIFQHSLRRNHYQHEDPKRSRITKFINLKKQMISSSEFLNGSFRINRNRRRIIEFADHRKLFTLQLKPPVRNKTIYYSEYVEMGKILCVFIAIHQSYTITGLGGPYTKKHLNDKTLPK